MASTAELMKRPGLITFLAVLHFVQAGFMILAGIAIFIAGFKEPPVGLIVGGLFTILGALPLACGLGLWKLRPWGRGLQIGLSCVGLLGFPLGTLISILILVYMFQPHVKILFSGKKAEQLSSPEMEILRKQAGSGAVIAAVVAAVFVGIFIMGIIAAIAIPNLLNAIQRGRQKRTIADIRTVASAVEAYAVDHNAYPDVDSMDDLKALLVPTYVSQLPATDGWNRPLKYESWLDNETDEVPTIYALGSAGKDGLWERKDLVDTPEGLTTDYNADIVFINGAFVQYPEGVDGRGTVGGTDAPRKEPAPSTSETPALRSDRGPSGGSTVDASSGG
jgi:general secretion pathway protein G